MNDDYLKYGAGVSLVACCVLVTGQIVETSRDDHCLYQPPGQAHECGPPLPRAREVDHTPRISLPTWTDVATATAVTSMDIGLDWTRV